MTRGVGTTAGAGAALVLLAGALGGCAPGSTGNVDLVRSLGAVLLCIGCTN